jgi:RecA-family ATPase
VPTAEENQKIAAVAQALRQLEPPPSPPKTWRDAFHTGSELGSTPGKVFIKGILEEGITYFSGQPLFGVYPVLNKANVLYLVPEMGGNKFRERLVRMRISMDGGFFCQTIKDGACDLEDPLLLQAVKDTQGVLILDTAIRFQHGDEQSSTEQAQGLGAKMFKLIAAGAPAVICMHHRSKDRKDKEPSLENTLRGTGLRRTSRLCVVRRAQPQATEIRSRAFRRRL